MNNLIQIHCTNSLNTYELPWGISLGEAANHIALQTHSPILCGSVNNRYQPLSYPLIAPATITFFTLEDAVGRRCYVDSLALLLKSAVRALFPQGKLRIEHAISNGYFCQVENVALSASLIAEIKEQMCEMVRRDIPLNRLVAPTQEVVDFCKKAGEEMEAEELLRVGKPYTAYYNLEGALNVAEEQHVSSTGILSLFDLRLYGEGMLLLPPSTKEPSQVAQGVYQPQLLEVFHRQVAFNGIIGLSNLSDLNRVIEKGDAPTLIQLAEVLHEREIAQIANRIAHHRGEAGAARLILIAGPSSSGKTTFTKRLSVQLMANLIRPISISLDDYFVNREDSPKDETGAYDFESLYTLDLALFNDHLTRLLRGEEVALPTYNFVTGKREYRGNSIQLSSSEVLLLEGIHALNPALTPHIPQGEKFRIYVSALTALSVDNLHWISTTDNRLLRRIIRDAKYRGHSAESTIAQWQSVRRGEERWIFPFQEEADAMFNSSLLFELAILKPHAEALLRAVPQNKPQFAEAQRLLYLLSHATALEECGIPPTSLLREFLGGSSFQY